MSVLTFSLGEDIREGRGCEIGIVSLSVLAKISFPASNIIMKLGARGLLPAA